MIGGDDPVGPRPEGAAGADAPRDRFYQGTIVRVHAGTGKGIVRTGSGRDVEFAVPGVLVVGTTRGLAALREGMRVGFDLGRTQRGLRVTVIRVYEDGEGQA